jgi:hypothetical protein
MKKGRHICNGMEKSAEKSNAAASHSPQKQQSGYGGYKFITLSSDITEEKSKIEET